MDTEAGGGAEGEVPRRVLDRNAARVPCAVGGRGVAAEVGGAQSFVPSDRVGDRDPVRPLVVAIDRVVADRVLAGGTTQIAVSLWAALHGLVSLELAGALEGAAAETAFRSTIDAVLRGWATSDAFPGLRGADMVP
ncbi:WHG domain-containing protein [Streptomyces sp. NPDC045456]|uniref:WHG domain-containing protein n=1 Tax=Streptomyces sp. NPDC045456 TaxID=3155254 RepID=UPI0033FA506D